MTTTIKYYENKEEHGLIIDWSEVWRRYKALKVPKEIFEPTHVPVDKVGYSVQLSERSVGKTSTWLLVGLIINEMYGIPTIYMREKEEQIAPKYAKEVYAVINNYDHGRYIDKITKGKWNTIIYNSRRFYYALRDPETGQIIDKGTDPICHMLAVELWADYKSVFNVPQCGLTIFDEFIGKGIYDSDLFVHYLDVLSTVGRHRKTHVNILLANTININHPFFREMCISKEVKQLKKGQMQTIVTSKGTAVCVELIGLKPTVIKAEVNSKYFGFDNPKLAAITGADETWAFDVVPHIPRTEEDRYIDRRYKIDVFGDLLGIDIVSNPDIGLCCYVHPVSKVYDDSIILTSGEITQRNQRYGLGHGKTADIIWRLYRRNKWYFSDNECGAQLITYLRSIKKLI